MLDREANVPFSHGDNFHQTAVLLVPFSWLWSSTMLFLLNKYSVRAEGLTGTELTLVLDALERWVTSVSLLWIVFWKCPGQKEKSECPSKQWLSLKHFLSLYFAMCCFSTTLSSTERKVCKKKNIARFSLQSWIRKYRCEVVSKQQ